MKKGKMAKQFSRWVSPKSDRVFAIRYRLWCWVADRADAGARPEWFWEWLFCATFVYAYYDDDVEREFPF
jgi:hypothetical protein